MRSQPDTAAGKLSIAFPIPGPKVTPYPRPMLWHSSAPKWQPLVLSNHAGKPPVGLNWIHEIKHAAVA